MTFLYGMVRFDWIKDCVLISSLTRTGASPRLRECINSVRLRLELVLRHLDFVSKVLKFQMKGGCLLFLSLCLSPPEPPNERKAAGNLEYFREKGRYVHAKSSSASLGITGQEEVNKPVSRWGMW